MIVDFVGRRKAVLRSVAVSAAALAFSAASAEASRLYLLSGTPTNGEALPVILYSADPLSPGPVRQESAVAKGLSCVLADYDRRVLVVASPELEPTKFFIIDMISAQTKEVDLAATEGGVDRVFLLNTPERGVGLALAASKPTPGGSVESESSFTFVGLNSSGPAVAIPFDDLRYTRFSGFVGGAVVMSLCEVSIRGNPLHVLLGKTAGTGIALPRPPYLSERDPNDSYMLIASDDARTIIRPLQPAEPGVIDVLNKASKEWRRVPIPFPSATMRTFGHWLAAIEERTPKTAAQTKRASVIYRDKLGTLDESPGAAKRRSEQIGPDYRREPGTTVDNLFETLQIRGIVYLGELLAYNLDTGIQLRISTGSGDSEIVFANDDAVYYRVDDALYRRQITGSTLGDAVKLVEGPEIVQVHWAFLN